MVSGMPLNFVCSVVNVVLSGWSVLCASLRSVALVSSAMASSTRAGAVAVLVLLLCNELPLTFHILPCCQCWRRLGDELFTLCRQMSTGAELFDEQFNVLFDT